MEMECCRACASATKRSSGFPKWNARVRSGLIWVLLLLMAFQCLLPSVYAAEEPTDEDLLTLYDLVEEQDLDVEERYRVPVDPKDLSIQEGLSEEWRNILLLGTDTGGMLNYGRTDAMLILSIHLGTGEIKLASLVRDMWVDIPGLKLPNRINAANAFGGPYLAIKTVNDVLDMNIRSYCSINFSGLEKAVDIVGGVSLPITPDEAAVVGAHIRNGVASLDGEQALAYARIRKLDSNFGRNERQRKLLEGLLHKVMQTGGGARLLSVVSEILPHMATNLELSDIIALMVTAMKNKDFTLDTLSLPQTGDYHNDSADGKSKVIFDREATVAALHAFIYGTDALQENAGMP